MGYQKKGPLSPNLSGNKLLAISEHQFTECESGLFSTYWAPNWCTNVAATDCAVGQVKIAAPGFLEWMTGIQHDWGSTYVISLFDGVNPQPSRSASPCASVWWCAIHFPAKEISLASMMGHTGSKMNKINVFVWTQQEQDWCVCL